MQLFYLPAACDDLDKIGSYIATDNPRRAVTFIEEIEAHCLKLLKMPLIGRSEEELAENLRSILHRHYVIFYSVHGDRVIIERILHGARDIESAFTSEE
jgi:toxin ParE1/3/4